MTESTPPSAAAPPLPAAIAEGAWLLAQDNGGRARLACIGLLAALFVQIDGLLFHAFCLVDLHGFGRSATGASIDFGLRLGLGCTWLLVLLAFGRWFHRAYGNAVAGSPALAALPAAPRWLLPVAWPWLPLRLLLRMWAAVGRERVGNALPVVGFWLAVLCSVLFAALAPGFAQLARDDDGRRGGLLLGLAANGSAAIACGLGLFVVLRLSRAQARISPLAQLEQVFGEGKVADVPAPPPA